MDESVTQPVTSRYTDNASPKLSAVYKGQTKMYLFRRNDTFFFGEKLSAFAQPPSWRTTLVGCPRMLTQYPPYLRPFLHLQPEDAPYGGDRDPLIIAQKCIPLHNAKPTESHVTAKYKPHYVREFPEIKTHLVTTGQDSFL